MNLQASQLPHQQKDEEDSVALYVCADLNICREPPNATLFSDFLLSTKVEETFFMSLVNILQHHFKQMNNSTKLMKLKFR